MTAASGEDVAHASEARGDCPECEAVGVVTLTPGLLPVCLACDWTGWDVNP